MGYIEGLTWFNLLRSLLLVKPILLVVRLFNIYFYSYILFILNQSKLSRVIVLWAIIAAKITHCKKSIIRHFK